MKLNMKYHGARLLCAALLSIVALQPGGAKAQCTAFTYQGRLADGGSAATGTYDMRFTIYDAVSGGSMAGDPVTNASTGVSNGLFTVALNFGMGVFTGPARWLEIEVRTNGSVGAYSTLAPRQELTAAPYALQANTASNLLGTLSVGQLSGSVGNGQLANSMVTVTAGAGLNGGGSVALGGTTTLSLSPNANAATVGGVAASNLWQTGGNNVGAGQFIGSINNQPLELWTGGRRALRLEPDTTSGAPNVIGGSSSNSVAPGVIGATVAGGGATNFSGTPYPNSVNANFGFIGGGALNAIGANGGSGTIGGGGANQVQGGVGTIGGGGYNQIRSSAYYGTIAGGYDSEMSGGYASIGGGQVNEADGFSAAIPGGARNLAQGSYSFAAGQNAAAHHDGAFVWSDSSDLYNSFGSTSSNQFLIRATGGVGINTNNPGTNALQVLGAVAATKFVGDGSGLTNLSLGSGASLTWQTVTGLSQQAQPNTGYIATGSAPVTITLPLSPPIGSTIRIAGGGSGGWQVAQNAGQTVLAGISAQAAATTGINWSSRAFATNWSCVASSADGTRLVAAVYGGRIYTSTDSGASWIARGVITNWSLVASSADGVKLVAADQHDGRIYTSTDSGLNWTLQTQNANWQSIASSADGTKLVGVAYGGLIYTSTDSGVTWTNHPYGGTWASVASSADGTRLVAVQASYYSSEIFTSTDSGATWTQHGPTANWYSVASSADGTRLVAAVNGGQIYTSTDSGTNWTARATSSGWMAVCSSADGSRLAAVNSAQVYTSGDSGATWSPHESGIGWQSIACSADGSRLVAAVPGGLIYTSTPVSASTTSTTPGTAGFLTGGQGAAIELLYIGSNQFVPVSFVPNILAY
jgi:hypothetical protein